MIRNIAVLLTAACLLPACLEAQEIEQTEQEARSTVRYLEWNADVGQLFSDDARSPVVSFIGFGEGVTVMFGHEGSTLRFAYFADAERFSDMLGRAQAENASVFAAPGSDSGLPWNKKPPSPPPIGEDLVSSSMVTATSTLAAGVLRAENAFAASFRYEESGSTRTKY